MDPILGEIKMFAGNFAPKGWMLCNGQLLSIAQNTALFSILGTTYGGDGRTTFALPDLRGRAPLGTGAGPGLSQVTLGERGGVDSMTLTQANLPPHSHALAVSHGDVDAKVAGYLAHGIWSTTGGEAAPADTIAATGGGQPFDNRQPYLGVNFIIAVQGIYPSRD